ncbi:MAG TPA: hypothetical protein ENH13_00940 [Euryarchaeota archaeon]|nr:hypothetical protein [Euryarchaeota archaeon]
MPPEVIFLRMFIDLLGALFGLRLTRRFKGKLKDQFTSNKVVQSDYSGFQIRCRNECIVSRVRINALIDETLQDPAKLGFYLDIEINGRFEALLIVLPVEITFFKDITHDEVSIKQSGKHAIFFEDNTASIEHWSSPNLYFSGAGLVKKNKGRILFSFPVASLWASGKSHSKGALYPVISSESKEVHHTFIPEIKEMEIDATMLNKSYSIDTQNTMPLPEAFSESNMRWFTASNGRPHTSILAAFLNGEIINSIEFESYKDGVFLALSASLVLATGLDALWTFIAWLTAV